MKQNNSSVSLYLLLVLSLSSLSVWGQKIDRDKTNANMALYNLLTKKHEPTIKNTTYQFLPKDLQKTYDQDIFLIKGTYYQLESINNDFYVTKSGNGYVPIFSVKYPLESFVNLMLNHIQEKEKKIHIIQYFYGGEKEIGPIPMSNINDLLGDTMDVFCSVTAIKKDMMEAVLVYHHRELDYIHLFTLKATFDQLFSKDGTIEAELHGNIPQDNIKNLFNKY